MDKDEEAGGAAALGMGSGVHGEELAAAVAAVVTAAAANGRSSGMNLAW